jgi:hypothetical protein
MVKVGVRITVVVVCCVCVIAIVVVLCGFQRFPVVGTAAAPAVESNAITVVIPTYDRDINMVRDTVRTYEAMDVVDKVILLEFTTGKNRSGHKNAVLLPNDLRNRFEPERFPLLSEAACPYVSSPMMFITDDDCEISEALLQSLGTEVVKRPTALHGTEGRVLDRKGVYNAVHRPRVQGGGTKVAVLLTWCVLARTDTMNVIAKEFREKYFDVARPLNGEDIALSMLAREAYAHDYGWLTWYGFPVSNEGINFKTKSNSLSSKPGFVQERQAITSSFRSLLEEATAPRGKAAT